MAYALQTSGLDYQRVPFVTDVAMIVLVAAGIRLTILWFQTVIDAASSAPGGKPRWGWLAFMVIAGPAASCLYYMLVLPVPDTPVVGEDDSSQEGQSREA